MRIAPSHMGRLPGRPSALAAQPATLHPEYPQTTYFGTGNPVVRERLLTAHA